LDRQENWSGGLGTEYMCGSISILEAAACKNGTFIDERDVDNFYQIVNAMLLTTFENRTNICGSPKEERD
jgi:hypothetical protein